MSRLREKPTGACAHTSPCPVPFTELYTASAVPLMYPPPTHVAVIVNTPTNCVSDKLLCILAGIGSIDTLLIRY